MCHTGAPLSAALFLYTARKMWSIIATSAITSSEGTPQNDGDINMKISMINMYI